MAMVVFPKIDVGQGFSFSSGIKIFINPGIGFVGVICQEGLRNKEV
jgi:hypothetical protein